MRSFVGRAVGVDSSSPSVSLHFGVPDEPQRRSPDEPVRSVRPPEREETDRSRALQRDALDEPSEYEGTPKLDEPPKDRGPSRTSKLREPPREV